MQYPNSRSTAWLSHQGNMTRFRCGNDDIRFRTSEALLRYISVKEWDNGYLVVMANYKGMGEVEDYIDLLPILGNLYVDAATFLKDIKQVEINYD